DNVKPNIEVRSKRVGGATYQVPMEISRKRQQTLAIRGIVGNTRGRKGKPGAQCLADELHDAHQRQGASIQWRENTHKMAEATKLFAHFAW
ncbi:MAG: 30S ribosomal protein S7, partial [Planctomycetes bacterium]|nr:30S ribosomal protein S7 [Planctomycetota bacterium]